jgi:hypothetical protein
VGFGILLCSLPLRFSFLYSLVIAWRLADYLFGSGLVNLQVCSGFWFLFLSGLGLCDRFIGFPYVDCS